MSGESSQRAEAAAAERPRRFYSEAAVAARDDGHAVLLDGRPVRTPARNPLVLPGAALAEAVAGEWRAQGASIDPASMPLTRLVNSALDGVAAAMAEVRADIARHAGTDLLCYRAEGPQGLVARQAACWDPVLAWARDALGAHLVLAEGIMHVAQPPAALARIDAELARHDAFGLAALHAMTTLTGSGLLALAVTHGRLSAEDAWRAAHVDEDWQIGQWGADPEAMARHEARWREMAAAARLAALTR